jgi:hypothetical protein
MVAAKMANIFQAWGAQHGDGDQGRPDLPLQRWGFFVGHGKFSFVFRSFMKSAFHFFPYPFHIPEREKIQQDYMKFSKHPRVEFRGIDPRRNG